MPRLLVVSLAAFQLSTIVAISSLTVREPQAYADEETSVASGVPPLLLIRSQGKYGLINRSGKLILEPRFDSLFGYDSSLRSSSSDFLDNEYSEGLRPARIGQQWGYIDKNGAEVIPPQFSMAGPFSKGRAQVRVGDAWGVIKPNGSFAIEPRYSYIGRFKSGIARIAVGGVRIEGGFPRSKWGYINSVGEQIIPATYDFANSFSDGRAIVNQGGSWRGESGLAFQGGLWGVIDPKG